MSVYQKYHYYDLSSDSDNEGDGDDDDDDDDDDHHHVVSRSRSSSSNFSSFNNNSYKSSNDNSHRCHGKDKRENSSLWGRSILHVDVDCFYVQCEELDRGLRDCASNNNNSNGNASSSLFSERPLAIGQKHIVVTCNYKARSRGVTKLMSKQDALLKCPDLQIFDGSDLQSYKHHSRRIYAAFRDMVQETVVGSLLATIRPESCSRNSNKAALLLPCKRNAMDEMVADLSTVVDALMEIESKQGEAQVWNLLSLLQQKASGRKPSILQKHRQHQQQQQQHSTKTFVFGEDFTSPTVQITEDQTGATSKIVSDGNNNHHHQCQYQYHYSLAPTRRNVHEECASHHQSACRKRLKFAMFLGKLVCQGIATQTGFHVSAGISVSPMLAKLSVIQKPTTINLLLPWFSPRIMYSMPLRKVHEIGSRTHKALAEVVEKNHSNNNNNRNSSKSINKSNGSNQSNPITVWDLLRVPRERIIEALLTMHQQQQLQQNEGKIVTTIARKNPSLVQQKCNLILDRCRGLDSTRVQDDGGGLSKTVSVENSFQRGKIITEACIKNALTELCSRLPPLIRDRLAWSNQKSLAYPTTIRLTIRELKQSLPKGIVSARRGRSSHSITRSKQIGICTQRGKALVSGWDKDLTSSKNGEQTRAVQTLRDSASPLLRQLLFQRENPSSSSSSSCISVTRMNLAVTNFQDAIVNESASSQSYRMRNNSILDKGNANVIATIKNGENRKRQSKCDTNSVNLVNDYFQGTQEKKRKINNVVASPVSATNRTIPSSSLGSAQKFSRTRIDQFFSKKPR